MLRYKSDLRTLGFIATYFVALAGAWALPFERTWLVLAATAFLCWISWINAVITHNVVHLPMWHSRAMNRVTKVVLSLTYGFPVDEYVPGHNLSHHRYTQTRRDVMRTTKVDFRWNLLNLLALFPTVAADVTRANIRYASFARDSRPGWYADRRLETFVTWGLKIALLLLDWKKALLFVFVPHLGAVWGVTTVNYLWHDGCDMDHEFNHSRNFVGKFFNWFHFNAGFHGMHHLEPGTHWSLLPQRHYEIISPHIHPALELKSFTVYMLKTFLFEPRRLTFDGKPVVMPQEGPDEDWIAAASDARPMAMAAAE